MIKTKKYKKYLMAIFLRMYTNICKQTNKYANIFVHMYTIFLRMYTDMYSTFHHSTIPPQHL